MKRLLLTALVLVFAAHAQSQPPVVWMDEILAAWEHTCRVELKIPIDPLPWIIFYDSAHAWHVQPDRAMLPKHRQLKQSVRFAGRRYPIFEVTNQGKLWVPDRDPIGLTPAAVAMPYEHHRKAFFIFTTPRYVLEAHPELDPSAAEDLPKFFAGMAMHELAHTRQLPWMMPELNAIQKRHRFPKSIDDNLIENTFRGNAEFRQIFDEAQRHFTAAIQATGDAAAKEHARSGLLALEGAAMWVQYRYSLRVAPPGQPAIQTVIKLAERTDSWAQSLGLGLFLLIDRFDRDWRRKFFSNAPPPSPLAVLAEAVAAPSAPR